MEIAIANYLGSRSDTLLKATPYRHWAVERTIENDLDEPITSFVFAQHGMEFACGPEDDIRTIFLYSNKYGGFDDREMEISFSFSRVEALALFGGPSKSGEKHIHTVLGQYGPWDRFAREGYSIHVRYEVSHDQIETITLMRADVVP